MSIYPGEIKHTSVNATADGDNAVIAAVAGKKIRVLGYTLTGAGVAGTATLQDTAGTPVVHGKLSLSTSGGVSYAGGLEAPAFETAAGTGVEVSNSTGLDTLGHMTYIEI